MVSLSPPAPFRSTSTYRLVLGALWANLLLAIVSVSFQIVLHEYDDLFSALYQWVLLGMLIGSPLYAVWSERQKLVPHTSEIICSVYSATAVFFIALYTGNGWPSFWLMPPLLFSASLIGAAAVSLRSYIREESDRQIAELLERITKLDIAMSRRRKPRWRR